MRIESLDEIIATRELYFDEQETRHCVQVQIGRPRSFSDSNGYYCPFQISGVGPGEVKYAAGVDPIQALQLVMVMIGASLRVVDEKLGHGLRWDGGADEADLGFPSN